jgi:hypothetical protein
MDRDLEEKIQSVIFETFQDVEREWISYFQHKARQMNLDQKSFFIGIIYPKIIKNLENNNIHIRIKSDTWADHEIERINTILNELFEKYVQKITKP